MLSLAGVCHTCEHVVKMHGAMYHHEYAGRDAPSARRKFSAPSVRPCEPVITQTLVACEEIVLFHVTFTDNVTSLIAMESVYLNNSSAYFIAC